MDEILTPSEVRDKLKNNILDLSQKNYKEKKNIYLIGVARYEEGVLFPYDKDFWEKCIKETAEIYTKYFGINPQKDMAAVLYKTSYPAAPRFYESVFRHLGIPTLTFSFTNKGVQWIVKNLLLRDDRINVIQTMPLFALQLLEYSKKHNDFPPNGRKIKLICSSARKAKGFSIPISQKMREEIQEKGFELFIFMGGSEFLIFGYNDGNKDADQITLMNIDNLLSFQTYSKDKKNNLRRLLVNSENKACMLKNYFTGDLVEVVEEKNGIPGVVKFKGRNEEVVDGIYDWQIRKVLDGFRDKVVGNYAIERADIYKRKDKKFEEHYVLRIPVREGKHKNDDLKTKILKKWEEVIENQQKKTRDTI